MVDLLDGLAVALHLDDDEVQVILGIAADEVFGEAAVDHRNAVDLANDVALVEADGLEELGLALLRVQ